MSVKEIDQSLARISSRAYQSYFGGIGIRSTFLTERWITIPISVVVEQVNVYDLRIGCLGCGISTGDRCLHDTLITP